MPEPKKAFQRHLLENVVAQEKQMERLNESAFSLGVIHHPTPRKKVKLVEPKNSGERERRQFCHFPAAHPISKFKMGKFSLSSSGAGVT